MSTSSQDLQLLRLMLSQQAQPQIKIDPVNNIGQGISVGANNIANALMQRRQQQTLATLLAAQQAQAQQALQQKVQAYQALGMNEAQANAAALDETMGRQIQEQAYKDKVSQDQSNTDLQQYNQLRNAYLKTPGADPNKADLVAWSGVYGKRTPIGGDAVGNAVGQDIKVNNIKQLAGPIAQAQTRQPTTVEEAVYNALGINMNPLYSRLKDANEISKGTSQATISNLTAQATPQLLNNQVTGGQLENQGKGISNQTNQNDLTLDNAGMPVKMGALNGTITPQAAALTLAILSNNPSQALSGMVGKNNLFKTPQDMTIPQPTQAQPKQAQQPKTSPPTNYFDPFSSSLNMTPEQRGSLFLNHAANGLGQGIMGLGNSVGQGLLGAGQAVENTGGFARGMFGLPVNPLDPFGRLHDSMGQFSNYLGR